MVGPEGLEPPTYPLWADSSNQLSYRPFKKDVRSVYKTFRQKARILYGDMCFLCVTYTILANGMYGGHEGCQKGHRSLRYCIIKMHLTSIGFSKVDNPIQKAVLSQEKESRNSFKNQLLMKKVRFLLLKGEKVWYTPLMLNEKKEYKYVQRLYI